MKGTVLPLVGVLRTQKSAGGVFVPWVDYPSEPAKYVSVFVTLEEYLGPIWKKKFGVYDNDEIIALLSHQYPREQLLEELAILNNERLQGKLLEQAQQDFESKLSPELLGHFKIAMTSGEAKRVFLARQPILRAMREVMLYDGAIADNFAASPRVAAIMLAHAFAGKLGQLEESGPELWPTVSASIAMEVIRNYLFNQQEDIYPRLDRYTRLWDVYGEHLERTKLRASPNQLLKDATGVERADIFAVAFSILARVLGWAPGQPLSFDPYDGIGMDRNTFDLVMDTFTGTHSTFVAELQKAPDDWQMLPFERHPILQLSDSRVIPLDQEYLLDRATSGLYWLVLDHEQRLPKEQRSQAMELWSGAYSEMIEALAEDCVRAMAPTILGSAVKTFYSEQDFAAAYGEGTRLSDAGIDFGNRLVLFEVQKGQVSLDTRQTGLVEKFFADTDRMVLEKAEQLDGTASAILKDQTALTGSPPVEGLRIRPVAVQGITYPVTPITSEYVKVKLEQRHLLSHPRIEPLAVIDLGELEMLEGLGENRGITAIEVLEAWQGSPYFRFSLRNYVVERYSFADVRPRRMQRTIDAMNRDLLARLKIAPPPESAAASKPNASPGDDTSRL